MFADDDPVFIPLMLQTNDAILPDGFSAARPFDLPSGPWEATPPDAPSPSVDFSGLDDNNTFNPPDTMGAVGTNHLMIMLNGQVRIQNRAGTTLSTTNLNGWWASAGAIASFVFDPKLLYDPYSHRWIAVALADPGLNSSALMIAASATSDPTGQWYRYRFYTDSVNQLLWADYPQIGFNKDKLVVTWTYYFISNNAAYSSGLAIVNKQTLYSGTAPSSGSTLSMYIMNPGALAFNSGPAATYDTNLSNMYLVGVNDRNVSGQGHLVVYTLGGTVTAPTLATNGFAPASAWSSTGYTPSAQNFARQLGTGQRIDTGDDRMAQVSYRLGSLWCAHTVFLPSSSPTRCGIQWWQLNPANGNVTQRGILQDTTAKTNYAYPSIAVNKFRDVMVGFSSFSSNHYASASYTFRNFYDGSAQLQAPALRKAGISPFWRTNSTVGNTDLRNRWGDYSATVVDPVNDIDLWTIQEYAAQYFGTLTNKSGRWGTWWGQLALPVPTNDSFANAIAITGATGVTNGTTIRASLESGEPNHAGITNSPSVWFTWIVPSNGVVSLNLTNLAGSGMDTTLAVYTGASVSGLTLVTNQHGGTLGSKVTFNATGGTTYRIAVAGFGGSSGDFGLDWIQPTKPVFTVQPHDFDVIAGSNITFMATAIAIPDPAYQWRFNGTNISSATDSSLVKNNVQTNDTGNYLVVATNVSGAATSSVAHLQVYVSATPWLSEMGLFTNDFRFIVSGVTGANYVVEASTNLINWTKITTNITTFTNIDRDFTNYPYRFYRALYQPQ